LLVNNDQPALSAQQPLGRFHRQVAEPASAQSPQIEHHGATLKYKEKKMKMTKESILAAEELLNELMERNQENERPLPPEQLVRVFLEIDWDSDEVRVAMELYEEIVATGIATPRQIDAALDRHADAVAKGEAKKMGHYEWLKATFVDPKLQ
jgi:hypothetical protein